MGQLRPPDGKPCSRTVDQWPHLIKVTNGQGDISSHTGPDNKASQGGHKGNLTEGVSRLAKLFKIIFLSKIVGTDFEMSNKLMCSLSVNNFKRSMLLNNSNAINYGEPVYNNTEHRQDTEGYVVRPKRGGN